MIPYRKVESCPQRHREKLNKAIKKEFKNEFGTSSDATALKLKFEQLDKNADDKLTHKEIRVLLDLRQRKPFDKKRTRVCIRNIISRCDNTNKKRDRKLGRQEWAKCFDGPINGITVEDFIPLLTTVKPSNSAVTNKESPDHGKNTNTSRKQIKIFFNRPNRLCSNLELLTLTKH